MEKFVGLSNIILLFDTYSKDSAWLHQSMIRADCDCLAVVVEENHFLPQDVFSVYELFLGYYIGRKRERRKPKFFNEIAIPDNWSISAGDEKCGTIHYQHEEKGKIYYVDTDKKRLVKEVDWYDRKGTVRFKDHYNRYGAVCARTIYDTKGRRVSKSWFSESGQEAIMENYFTGDIIINDGNITKFFRSKLELILYFFAKAGFGRKRIFYNSLSMPLFLSNRLKGEEKKDILFWQEPVGTEVPGNMKMILNGQANRTAKILVQKRESFNRLCELGVRQDIVYKLGFIYDFEKKNNHKPEALICTDSDKLEHCREIVEALPEMQFHIASITLMSEKLMSLEKYDNVNLYPGAKLNVFEELFKRCDYYFDINYRSEIVSAVFRAFLHNQLIFAFQETAHNREYMADAHIYPAAEFGRMVLNVRNIMEDKHVMKRHLKKQHEHAMAENKETYIRMLE